MNSVTRPLAWALALLLASAAAIGGTAHAANDPEHLKDHGRWAFRGFDTGDDNSNKPSDPMTILYFGGRYKGRHLRDDDTAAWETTNHIKETLKTYYHDKDGGNFDVHGCLEGHFLRYRGHPRADNTDLNMSTSGGCKNEWHTRIWNSKEITGDELRDAKWAVGGIHREHRCNPPGLCKHHLNYSFETAEVKYLHNLKTCHIHDWRALPGSGPGKFSQGKYSDGKISRVSMTPLSAGCKGAWSR